MTYQHPIYTTSKSPLAYAFREHAETVNGNVA